MSSDAITRLREVQTAQPSAALNTRQLRVRRVENGSRAGLDFPDGMPDDASDPVSRDSEGRRIYDEHDIPAILALAELAVMIERKWIRHVGAGSLPTTAVESHLRDHGHRLHFGCCRRRATAPERQFGEE
jgi:hypothetical protein